MNKSVVIVINGEEKEVTKWNYTFEEIVKLAFGGYDESKKSYTMISTKKNDDGEKHSKSYSFGDEIKVKEGMRINVDSTSRS